MMPEKLRVPFLDRFLHRGSSQPASMTLQDEPAAEVAKVVKPAEIESEVASEGLLDPTETFNYLMLQVVERRQTIEPAVFKRDQDMYRRVGLYEKTLTSFLGQPDILQIGDEIHKHQLWMEVLTQSHQKDIEAIEQKRAILAQQRVELLQEQQRMVARIAAVGRNPFIAEGSLGLLQGRVEVEIGHLQKRKRPFNNLFIGIFRLFRLIGDAREVHPQIAPYLERLAQINAGSIKLGGASTQADAEYGAQRQDLEKQMQAEQENLLVALDRWAIEDYDRFLVHLLYYPDRRFRLIQQYRSGKQMSREDWQNFLGQLKDHDLLPPAFSDSLPTPQSTLTERPPSAFPKKAEGQDTTKLPIPLIIGGQIFTDVDLAMMKFIKLTSRLSQERQERMFKRLVMALKYEAQGWHYPDATVLKADDMVERLGGEWRLRVGRDRVIGNLFNLGNGQKVMEVVKVIQRDHPDYY